MIDNIGFSKNPHPIQEGPISKEDLKLYRNDAAKILANVSCRGTIQTDISTEYANNIEIFSEEELFTNIKETLKFETIITNKLEGLKTSIEKIKQIERSTGGLYGLSLEREIPAIEEKYATIKAKIEETYKKGNTHERVSEREKEQIANERKTILREIDKFQESLREYLP